jgi:hypothetical protein
MRNTSYVLYTILYTWLTTKIKQLITKYFKLFFNAWEIIIYNKMFSTNFSKKLA